MTKRVSLSRQFSTVDAYDLSVNTKRVIEITFGHEKIVGADLWARLFGGLIILKTGRAAVNYISVATGVDTFEKGILGQFQVVGLSGVFDVGYGKNGSPEISVDYLEEEDVDRIEAIFAAIDKALEEQSIYRGKAIELLSPSFEGRRFLDISGVSEEDVVYSLATLRELEDNVWFPIERADLGEKIKAPRQNKVLIAGSFGTGKTLAGLITAQRAIKSGWTFVYLPTGWKQHSVLLPFAFELAARYERTVLFIEDFDAEQQDGDPALFRKMLESLDGLKSKAVRIIVLMTTNYPSKIGPAMQRPGRIDRIIDLDLFTKEDIERLLKRTIAEEFLDKSINWEEVCGACEGFAPAFIRRVADSAKLMAVGRSARCGRPPIVQEEDLKVSAKNLEWQNENCRKAPGIGFRSS